ncbi:MAG: hypothetical protein HMLKMBBP_01886 [Planctomycetes bacterium]|nr:hypothetical protein [Planctomycetota bacterium]
MNAVFERDFVRVSTSARFLLLRAALGVGVSLVLGLLLLGAYASSSFDEIGRNVLLVTVGIGAPLVVAAAPGSFATVLVHARAQNTLGVLLSTPLTPRQLASGAFGARAALLAVFVLATLPPLAIALLFGGVEVAQVGAAILSMLSLALLCAAPSFVVSAFARRTGVAVVSAYLTVVTLLAALSAAGDLLPAPRGIASSPWAAAFSPIHGIALARNPGPFVDTVLAASGVLLALSAALSVGAVLFATWRLRAEARGDVEASITAGDLRPARRLRFENPILDRERTLASRRFQGSGLTILVLLVLSEVGYGLAVHHGPPGSRTSIALFGWTAAFQFALLLLGAAAAGATCFAAERETGALDVLRATALRPLEIVHAKVSGILHAQLPCLIIPAGHLAWGAAVGIVSPLAIPLCALAGAVAVGAWTVFGIAQSLDQKEPSRAVVRTMLVLGIVGVLVAGQVGWPLSAAVLKSDGGADSYAVRAAAFGANPVVLALAPAAALRTGGSTAESTDLAGPSAGETGGVLAVTAFWLLLYAGAAAIVYRRLAHVYRTRFEA